MNSPSQAARRLLGAAAVVYAALAAVLVCALARPAAVLAAGQVQCLHQATAPSPPAGGVVFARPEDSDPASVNVVVIPPGARWSASGTCPASTSASAAQMMTHPRTIAVGAG